MSTPTRAAFLPPLRVQDGPLMLVLGDARHHSRADWSYQMRLFVHGYYIDTFRFVVPHAGGLDQQVGQVRRQINRILTDFSFKEAPQ
jgi:hypothetical protein